MVPEGSAIQEFVGVKGIPVAVGIPNLLDMFKGTPPTKRSFSKTPSILISHPITSATAASHFDSSKMDAEGSAATILSHRSYSSLFIIISPLTFFIYALYHYFT